MALKRVWTKLGGVTQPTKILRRYVTGTNFQSFMFFKLFTDHERIELSKDCSINQ